MSKPLFLMPYDGKPDYGGMVDDFRPRHQAYCDRHGYEFCADAAVHDEVQDWMWDKIFRLRHYLREGKHSHIFWMDADVIVTDLSADMRDTVGPDKWLGMVKHGGSWNGEYPWHYNTGVMYLYACPEALQFIEEACEWFYKPRNWQDNNEQTAIMKVLLEGWCSRGPTSFDWHSCLNVLHHTWNANWNDKQWSPGATAVMGFHGAGKDDVHKALYGDPLPFCSRRILMREFAQENKL